MQRTGILSAVLAVLLILIFALAGCGKKGALYLPDHPRPGKKAQKSSEVPPPVTPAPTPQP